MTKPSAACFCIAGWHYPEEIYSRLRETELDLYVVAHRLPEEAVAFLPKYVPQDRLFCEPNLGYDWGCYQQFLARDYWKRYTAVFFIHDDLTIASLDFIPHTLALLSRGAKVVGNGQNHPKQDWPKTHTQCYAHSRWLPPSPDYKHPTVRGSFFAVSREAIEKLQGFEVFWDPRRLYIRFGNHSLIASCGKLQWIFGQGCFAFLGEEYRSSSYISEQERGGGERSQPTLKQRLAVYFYIYAGRAYVNRRMQSRHAGDPVGRRLGSLLAIIDGVDRTNL